MPPRGGSATRAYQSSSPDFVKESLVGRRTRATRSASAELGASGSVTTRKRGAVRNTRQVSVESAESSDDVPAITATPGSVRRRKATPAMRGSQDLSMVPEDEEGDELEDEVAADQNDVHGETQDRRSPGAESAVSGSSTYVTSHSAAEVADLDPMLAEILPDLFRSSHAILHLLAPPNASEEVVVSIKRDLNRFGSKRASRLKHDEAVFSVNRSYYGSDWYINPVHTLRRLFGTNDPGDGDFRPDVVLHTANMATAIRDLLVISKESRITTETLSNLSSNFPKVFVSNFFGPGRAGGSALYEETLDLAIGIRTQLAIAYLRDYKDDKEQKLTPHVTLASVFYDAPLPSPSSKTYFDDLFRTAQLRRLMVDDSTLGNGISKVTERILAIQSAFRRSSEAADAGDLVDFDSLEEWFPWSSFLVSVVKWCGLRMDEIARNIIEHGGIDKITKSLVNAVKDVDSQADVSYDPPSFIVEPPSLLPAANIVPAPVGQSLYDGKKAVAMLEMLKRGTSVSHSLSAQNNQDTSSMPPPPTLSSSVTQQRGSAQDRANQQPKVRGHQVDGNDFRATIEDDEADDAAPRSTGEYLQFFNDHIIDKNKENHLISGQAKVNPQKFRLLDRQPDAVKISWEGLSQASTAGPSTQKRHREERAVTEETEDFQNDPRVPDPARRMMAAIVRHRTPAEEERPPQKRSRVQSPIRDTVAAGRRENEVKSRPTPISQSHNLRRGLPNDVQDIEDDESGDERPPYSQVNIAAKRVAMRAQSRSGRSIQKRVAWSEHDEEHLISLIEDYGCGWAYLQEIGDFEYPRDQVALKDKARNMKAGFIKAGVHLPTNFHLVTLGAKEKAAIWAVRPHYRFED